MNISTLDVQKKLQASKFISSNFHKTEETEINENKILLQQYLLKQSKLFNNQRSVVSNNEINNIYSDFDRATRLNTSTILESRVFETLQFNQNQGAFDWINNRNPLDRIYHLGDLQENWDYYGAASFSKGQIERAIRIYLGFLHYSFSLQENYLDILPFVAPCSDSSILLEWSGNRFPVRQLELYIPNDLKGNLQYLKSSKTGDEESEIAESQLSMLFSWLFEKTR